MLTRKSYVECVFLVSLFPSVFARIKLRPKEFLCIVQHEFYRSLVGKWMRLLLCLCPHTHNTITNACTHVYCMRKPNSLLACTWLTVNRKKYEKKISVSSLPLFSIHNSVRFRIFNRSAAGRSRSSLVYYNIVYRINFYIIFYVFSPFSASRIVKREK
jgi:hypothetical protein